MQMLSLRRPPFKQTLSEPFWGLPSLWTADRKILVLHSVWPQWTLNTPQVTTQINSRYTHTWRWMENMRHSHCVWWLNGEPGRALLWRAQGIEAASFVPCPFCRCSPLPNTAPPPLAHLEVNLLSSYLCKTVSLICPGCIPFFELWAGQHLQRESKHCFWKLHFWLPLYLSIRLPSQPNAPTYLVWSPGSSLKDYVSQLYLDFCSLYFLV